jgi:pimeloyl-ACP methyl ester carboxylesterase
MNKNKDTRERTDGYVRRTCMGPVYIPLGAPEEGEEKSPQWNTFVVKNEGADLYCRSLGTGTPVLLIHGLGCDSNYFLMLGEFLSQQYKVVLYDRRGYGRSEGAEPNYRDRDDFGRVNASDAAAVMRAIGGKFNVCAHSAGALISLYLVSLFPELINQLIAYEMPLPEILPENSSINRDAENILRYKDISFAKAFYNFIKTQGEPDDRSQPLSEEEAAFVEKNGNVSLMKEYEHIYRANGCPLPVLPQDIPVILAAGDRRDNHAALCTEEFAKRYNLPLIYYPGGHNSAREIPSAFAAMTVGIFHLDLS